MNPDKVRELIETGDIDKFGTEDYRNFYYKLLDEDPQLARVMYFIYKRSGGRASL